MNSPNDKIGRFVRIYLKNGYTFQGAVISWDNNEGVQIKSPQGEVVTIPFLTEVCAFVFITKADGSYLKERSAEAHEPKIESVPNESQIDRIKSLVELHKLKSSSERELAKSKLRSPICAASPVEYDTISILRTLKNNPRE